MNDFERQALREDFERGIPQRQLAEKYGVPRSTLGDWARRGGWQRRETPAPPAPAEADRAAVRRLARKVMRRTDQLLDGPDELSARDLKSTCSLLLDMRNLLELPAEREDGAAVIAVRFVDTDGAER